MFTTAMAIAVMVLAVSVGVHMAVAITGLPDEISHVPTCIHIGFTRKSQTSSWWRHWTDKEEGAGR